MSAIEQWLAQDEINITNLNTKNVVIGNLNQSIDGIKTFENFPLSISMYPTNPLHFATKAYVDLIGGGGGSIVTQLPDLTDVDNSAFVYTQYNVLTANFSDSKFYSRTADQANLVDKSSAQTLTGKKTFDISTPANWPIVSNASTDPPSDGAFATKKYVDDLAGGGAYVTLATTQLITGLKTFNNQYLTQSFESESNYPYFTLSRTRTAGADLQVSDVVGEMRFNGQIDGSLQEVVGFMALASGDAEIDSSALYINMFHGTEPQLARFSFESSGYLELFTGIKIFNNNTSGKILQSNGTAYIPVTLDAANIVTKNTEQTISGNKSFSGTLENISTGTPIFVVKSSSPFFSGNTIGQINFRDFYNTDYETRVSFSAIDLLSGGSRCGRFSIVCTVNGVAVGGDEFIFDHNVHFDCKGYKISGAAPSGNLLIGNGTVFTSSTPDSGGIVTKSGSQTIDGVKTFLATTWPVINNYAVEPTSNAAFTTKYYVDQLIAGVSGGANELSDLTDVTGTLSYTNYNILSANGSSFITRTLDNADIVSKSQYNQTITGKKRFTYSDPTEFRGNIYISKAESGALPAGAVPGIFSVYGVDDNGTIMDFGSFSTLVVNSSHSTPRSKVRIYLSASTTQNYYEFDENGYFIAPVGFKTGLTNPTAYNMLLSNGTGFVSISRENAQIVTTDTTQNISGVKTFFSNSYPNIYLKNNNNGIPLGSGIMGAIRFTDNSTYSPIIFARKNQGICFSTKNYFDTASPFWMDQNGYFSCNGIKLWEGIVTDPPMPPYNAAGLILHSNGTAFVGNTPDGAGLVTKTGSQTIDGVKTFSSIPILPATNPTSANQAVRKAYVDSLIGGGGASSLPGLSDVYDLLTYTNYNVLQADGTQFTSRPLDAANIVDKSSNQSINGVKSFLNIPYLPNSNPIDNNHVVRKLYVDQLIAGVGGGVSTLPQLTDVTDSISYTNNNVLSANGSQFTSRTPDSANLVDRSSNQTIYGVKTFSSLPFLPLTDPTSLYQATNKNYVDNKFNSITGSYVTTNTSQTITGDKIFENQYLYQRVAGTVTPLFVFLRSWTGSEYLPINSVIGATYYNGSVESAFGYTTLCATYSMLTATPNGGTGRHFIALRNNGVFDFETFVFHADGTAVAKNSWATFTGSHIYQSIRDDLEINSAVILKDDGTIDYTNIENDRRFIGIIVLKKNNDDLYDREGNKIKDSMGNEIDDNNSVYVVAAVGDCLTNNNSGVKIIGNVKNGDSLCTSSVEGCLVKRPEGLDFIAFIEGRAMIARQTIEDKTATEESVIYATFVN
jgi:hypothetical protein